MEFVTKEEMQYIKERDETSVFTITNRQHPKKKKRYLAMTGNAVRLLYEFKYNENNKIVEKHGWFEETYLDNKTGQIKTHKVYYK